VLAPHARACAAYLVLLFCLVGLVPGCAADRGEVEKQLMAAPARAARLAQLANS
jgi:hypothetical protein